MNENNTTTNTTAGAIAGMLAHYSNSNCSNYNTFVSTIPAGCLVLIKTTSTAATTMTVTEEYSFIKIFLISIIIAAMVVSNSLIVIAFLTSQRLQKKPSNFLITSQACSDLFTCFVFFPVHMAERYHTRLHIEGFFVCYMIFLSLFNLMALCMDRYLALHLPFRHHRLTNIRRVLKLILAIWTTPCLITVLPLFWKYTRAKELVDQAFLVIIWAIMCLLVISMTALYFLVSMKAKRLIRNKKLSILSSTTSSSTINNNNKNTNNQKRNAIDTRFETKALTRKELRVVHLFGLLLLLFVATYLPLIYMNFCDAIGRPSLIPQEMEEVSLLTLMLGSLLNPIISMCLKRDFQQHFRCFFRQSIIHKFQSFKNLSSRNDSIALMMMVEPSFIIEP